MFFWTLFYITALLLTILGQKKVSGKSCKWIRIILVVFIAFVSLLQSNNGSDIEGYRRRFEVSTSVSSIVFSLSVSETKELVEIGYNLVAFILNKIHIGFSGMLLLTYLFLNGVFVHFIYKFKFPILGILAFLVSITFFQQINLQRQMIAIAFFFLGIEQIEKERLVRFIILILLGVLFHFSVFFLLPICFLRYLKIEENFKIMKLLCGVIWFLSIFVSLGVISAGGLLSGLSGILGDTQYSEYLSVENDVGMDTDVSILFQLLMLLVLLSDNKQNCLYLILYTLGCVFANISTAIPNMVRFALYFTAFSPLFVAQLVSENINRKYLSIVSYAYCAYYFLYRVPVSISSHSIMLPDYSVLNGFFQ